MSAAVDISLLKETPVFRVGRHRNVVFIGWFSYPEDDAVSAIPHIERAIREAYESEKKPVALVVVIHPDMPSRLPGGALRANFARLRKRWSPHIVAEAAIFASGDWRVSLFSTFMKHLERLTGPGIKLRIFTSVRPALTWVVQELPDRDAGCVYAADLLEAGQQLDLPGFAS